MNKPPIAILSTPRAGNHFVRYLVEFLSGRCTLGVNRTLVEVKESGKYWKDGTPILEGDSPVFMRPDIKFLNHVSSDNPIGVKFHFADPRGRASLFPIGDVFEDISSSEKLIYIQREPLDNLISMLNNVHWNDASLDQHVVQLRKKVENDPERQNIYTAPIPQKILKGQMKEAADGSYENLKFFQDFKGPKLMIMYEMLAYGDYRYSIQELAKLVNGPQEYYNKLGKDFEKYRKDSMAAPHRPPLTLKSYELQGKKEIGIKGGHRGPLAHRRNLLALQPENYQSLMSLISPMVNDQLIQQLYAPLLKAHDLGTPAVTH